MTTLHTDRLIADYLRRLEAAAAVLPSARRADLVAEIREHIDDAVREAAAADEVTIRNVLERLGPPEEIVAAAGGAPASSVAPASASRLGRLEIVALLALGIGGVLPLLGWVLGAIFVALSDAWSNRDKVIGLLLGMLPAAVLLVVLLVGADGIDQSPVPPADEPVGACPNCVETTSGGLGPFEIIALTFGFAAGVPSALYLAWRLRRISPDRALGPVEPAPSQAIVASAQQ